VAQIAAIPNVRIVHLKEVLHNRLNALHHQIIVLEVVAVHHQAVVLHVQAVHHHHAVLLHVDKIII
jgi:hypothetical protein